MDDRNVGGEKKRRMDSLLLAAALLATKGDRHPGTLVRREKLGPAMSRFYERHGIDPVTKEKRP